MRQHRWVLWSLLVLLAGFALLFPPGVYARPLASFDLTVAGIDLTVGPATQQVPKGVTSTVATQLTVPQASIPLASLQKLLPQNLTVKGELSGPAFATPLTLSAPAGTPLTLPTLPLLGTYTLKNLRLMAGADTLLAASPSVVTIQAIDDVLVTKVVTRPLSLDEIRDRGIVVDQSNFTVLNFTAVVGTSSNQVPITFPVAIPKAGTPTAGGDGFPPEPPALSLPNIATPNLVAKPITFVQVLPPEEGVDPFELPPIPALLVFPGNIGFLHQFFQALLIVTNGAPDGSVLNIQDLTATIQLPTGEDKTAGTDEAPGDDPLRVARLEGQGYVHSLPVKAAGADGQFGTGDDATLLTPGMTGHADFSVEGLKEGVHEVVFTLQGTLLGLPRGPVAIQGRARGAILVRNPNFALTLSHPSVVRRGETYDLFATILNTSVVDANLVSISLDPLGVSGAQLLSDSRVEFETIKAGESATAKFSLQSQRTGQVTATAVQSDEGILGRFNLRAGVGELGIPLSPDTLVLPTFANTVPEDLLEAAMGLLGQAYSVATAPEGALPAGVARIPRGTVTVMANTLSEAGLRIQLGETVLRSVEELLVDFAGSTFADPAFDSLRQQSSQGAKLAAAAGLVLGADATGRGLLDFQQALAGNLTSRDPHLSVVAGPGLHVWVSDDGAGRLGSLADGPATRSLPYGEHVGLGTSGTLDLVTRLGAAQYTVQAVATAAGSVDLGLVFPTAAGGLEQVRWSGIAVEAGSALSLTLVRDAANTYALAIDDTGDGRPDRTLVPTSVAAVPDRGPEVVSVVQIVNQFPAQLGANGASRQLTDKFGRLVAVLFSERVDLASASALSSYAAEANQVTQIVVQPSGRLVALYLQNPVGPLVPRTLTLTGLKDVRGNPLTPASVTRTITATIGDGGGVVSGTVRAANGSPLGGAMVTVEQETEDDYGFAVTQKVGERATDAQGRYQFDFVLGGSPFTLTVVAPGGQDSASIRSTLTEPAQHMNVDLVMLGRGAVAGIVRTPAGAPVANAVVSLQALGMLQSFAVRAAGDGSYRVERVPVGGFTVTAYDTAANRGYAAGTLATAGSTAQADVTILPPVALVSVSGQVFRADGSTPIVGVPVLLTAGTGFTAFAYTDATASFRFANLPSGVLSLRAYEPATGESGQATVTLAPGATATVNILFSGLGTITGQVVKANGAPVPNANVVAGASLVTADAAGRFTIPNVPVGSQVVRGQDPETGNIGGATVALLTPGQTVSVTVILPAVGTITGRVFEGDGVTPVLDPDVRIVTQGGYFPAAMDESGMYRFENFNVGTYQLAAIKGTSVIMASVTIAADGQVVRKDFTLPTGTGTVTGTVIDQGSNNQPVVATVTLRAQLPGPTGAPELAPFANVISDATTGRFTFENVPLGPVSVMAKSILRPNPASANGTLSTAGQVLDFPLVLQANVGSISGTVVGTDGNAVGAGFRVSVENQRFPVVTVTTNDAGHYAFAAILPQDTYMLTPEDPVTGLKGQAWVSVTAGQDLKVNPRILGKGSVLVTVREANGTPVLDGSVELRGGTFVNDQASGILTPDRNGQFRFANITEGPFSVTARDADGLKGLTTGSVPRAGAEAAVTITLTPAGIITGRLRLPGNAGVPSAQITLTDAGGTPVAFTTTSSDPADLGRFTFTTVPVGSYGLQGFDPATGRRGATGVRVDRDGQTVTVDFATVSLGTVTGTVFSGDGTTPVAGADVRITPTGTFSQPALTQSAPDGSFTFPGVSAGGFSIQVTDPVTLLAGSAKGSLGLEGETVTLPVLLEPSGTVAGRVLRADRTTPVANAQMTLVRPGTTFTRSMVSEADGSYSFAHIPVGDIWLSAKEPAGIDLAGVTGRIGGEGDLVAKDLVMVGTGTLTGTLFDSNGVDPVAGVTVTARSLGANALTLATATAEDGTFRFDRFPVGGLNLTARTVAGLAAAVTGTLADGATLTLRVVLEASGTVGGLVFLPDGETLARGIVITLTSPRLITVTQTESDGRFLFDGVPLTSFHLNLLDPIGGGIQKVDGSITTNGQAFDAGTLTLDDRAIAIATVSPLDGAVDVPVASVATVTFSEKVARSTVTSSSVRVLADGSPIWGTLSFAANDTQVIFTPMQPFTGAKRHTVQVTTAVTDLVGHPLLGERVTSFTTIDNIPPTVAAISPATEAIQVDPSAVVRVTFSEAIDPTSITPTTITVTGAAGPVAGRTDLILNNTVLVFTPNAPLAANAQYGVTLGTVRDRAGNALGAQTGRTFTTIDTIPPTVSSLSLPAGARAIEARSVTLTASSPDSDVARVEFFADATLLGTVTARPFALTALLPVPTTMDRSMVLSAIAVDRVGNRGTAASLLVTVEPPLPTLTSLLPAALPLEMGATGTLTVTISRVQPADTAIALATDRPGVATVPASIPVPAGQLSAAIPATTVIPGTATITASLNDTTAHSTVTVTPVGPTVANLQPATSQITQGASGTLTLTLTAAPAADAEVILSSSNPGVVGLPPSGRIIVPAGQTQQAFAVFGGSPGQATITASFNYTSALSQVSVVTPQAQVVSLLPPVLPLSVGARGALTVTLNASQPADTVVLLATSDAAILGLPADRIAVPAHQRSATLYVTGLTRGLATVTASFAGSTASVAMEVVPPLATLSALSCPTALAEGATALCRVTLNAVQAADTGVPLVTTTTDLLQAPPSVTVPAGSLSADVGVTALAQGQASLVAGLLNETTQSADVRIVPATVSLSSLTAGSASLLVGAITTLSLRFNAAAAADTPVSLASSPPGILAMPATVTVPAGQASAEITITGTETGAAMVTAGPVGGTTVQVLLTVNQLAPALSALDPTTLSLPKGTARSLAVTLAPTQDEATVVPLTSSDPSVEVPQRVTVAAGESTAAFPVLGRSEGTSVVSAGPVSGTSRQATVTVTAPEVLSLGISPPVASIGRGETQQFTATATYTDTTTREVTSEATWASSDTGVATIASPGGLAQGIGEGQATMTATFGGVRAGVRLTVTLWPSSGPVVAGFAPDRGTVGTTVQIYGSGFSPRASDNHVAFNAIPATVSAATGSELTTSVPLGASTGAITVTVGGLTASSPTPFTVLQTFAIVPTTITAAISTTVGFQATLDGLATTAVTWRVNGVPGGNSSFGTINTLGLYTAPASVPAVLPLTIDAVLASDPTRIVAATVQIVSTAGTFVAPAVSVAIAQPMPTGNAQALTGPVSVAIAQLPPSGSAWNVSGPVSVAIAQPAPTGNAQATAAPVSVSMGPIVTGVSPASARVGTATPVTISGGNLQEAFSIQMVKDGVQDTTVTATGLTWAPDGTSVTCTLTIAPGATTGARVLRVVTPQGRSTSVSLGVNVFTVQP